MFQGTRVLVLIVLFSLLAVGGCKKKYASAADHRATVTVSVKTHAAHPVKDWWHGAEAKTGNGIKASWSGLKRLVHAGK